MEHAVAGRWYFLASENQLFARPRETDTEILNHDNG